MPTADAPVHDATAFGLRWRADIPLDRFSPAREAGEPDVLVRRVPALADRALLTPVNRGHVCADGIRLAWRREVAFDMFEGARIDYAPDEDWRGALPLSFYSTIAALTLAWRGAIPFHASAVEVDGRAILLCGPAGAGKSTLTAGLISQGAGFIADDLTVVASSPGDAADLVLPGRPAMRLHAATAGWIDAASRAPEIGDPGGKWLVRPATTAPTAVPLAGFLLLGPGRSPLEAAARYPLLRAQLFRPKWFAAMPNAPALATSVLHMAAKVRLARFEMGEVREESDFRQRANLALAVIKATILR